MEKILQGISQLKGVNHACIYNFKQDDKGFLGTTFPATQQENIQNSTDMIEQVFSALQAIDKKHNELYFSVENKYLAAYLMDEQHIAILLTEKRINFPLIHMGIRSASKKLQNKLRSQRQQTKPIVNQEKLAAKANKVEKSDKTRSTNQPSNTQNEPELSVIFDQFSKLLMSYLGTEADSVCREAIDTWQATYVPNRQNLDHLISTIQASLANDTDRQNFALIAKNLYK
jgi:hypothetical protein